MLIGSPMILWIPLGEKMIEGDDQYWNSGDKELSFKISHGGEWVNTTRILKNFQDFSTLWLEFFSPMNDFKFIRHNS